MSISRKATENPFGGLLPSIKPEEPVMVEVGIGEGDALTEENLDIPVESHTAPLLGLMDTFLSHYRSGTKTDSLNSFGGLSVGVGGSLDPRFEKVKLKTTSIYLYFK